MQNIWKNYREYISIGIFLIVVLVMVFFVIKPLWISLEAKVVQIEKERLEYENQERRIGEISKLREQYKIILEKEGLLDVLISRDGAVSLIEELEKMAEESGNKIEIRIKNIDTSDTKARKVPDKEGGIIGGLLSDNRIEMTLILEGDYGSSTDFLRKLENMKYFGDVIGLQMVRKENGEKNRIQASNPFSSSESGDLNMTQEGEYYQLTTIETVFYLDEGII